jgi:uncharacterized protein (DUF488 family)
VAETIYYRQKVLLRLLDAAGGQLSNTDCQKLLFLLCKATKNFYDFFPYNFGGFSHVLYADKRHLIKTGFLAESDSFTLRKARLSASLKSEDVKAIKAILDTTTERGSKLIKKLYREEPYFAHRSTIAEDILNPTELKVVKAAAPKPIGLALFTIGYEGISIDRYINTLMLNGVTAVVDVRSNPLSRKFGFSAKQLESYLSSVDISYVRMPKLGVPNQHRRNLGSVESYNQLEKFYETVLLSNISEINKIEKLIKESSRIALTCFEANPDQCHRHYITDYFSRNRPGIPIVNL